MKNTPKYRPGLNKSNAPQWLKAKLAIKTQSRQWQKLDSNYIHNIKINKMEKVSPLLRYLGYSLSIIKLGGNNEK